MPSGVIKLHQIFWALKQNGLVHVRYAGEIFLFTWSGWVKIHKMICLHLQFQLSFKYEGRSKVSELKPCKLGWVFIELVDFVLTSWHQHRSESSVTSTSFPFVSTGFFPFLTQLAKLCSELWTLTLVCVRLMCLYKACKVMFAENLLYLSCFMAMLFVKVL